MFASNVAEMGGVRLLAGRWCSLVLQAMENRYSSACPITDYLFIIYSANKNETITSVLVSVHHIFTLGVLFSCPRYLLAGLETKIRQLCLFSILDTWKAASSDNTTLCSYSSSSSTHIHCNVVVSQFRWCSSMEVFRFQLFAWEKILKKMDVMVIGCNMNIYFMI